MISRGNAADRVTKSCKHHNIAKRVKKEKKKFILHIGLFLVYVCLSTSLIPLMSGLLMGSIKSMERCLSNCRKRQLAVIFSFNKLRFASGIVLVNGIYIYSLYGFFTASFKPPSCLCAHDMIPVTGVEYSTAR